MTQLVSLSFRGTLWAILQLFSLLTWHQNNLLPHQKNSHMQTILAITYSILPEWTLPSSKKQIKNIYWFLVYIDFYNCSFLWYNSELWVWQSSYSKVRLFFFFLQVALETLLVIFSINIINTETCSSLQRHSNPCHNRQSVLVIRFINHCVIDKACCYQKDEVIFKKRTLTKLTTQNFLMIKFY